MESVTLVIDALKWAFKTFADNLVFYFKLFAVAVMVMLIAALPRFFILMVTTFGQLNLPVDSLAAIGLMAFISGLSGLALFYFTLGYINVALCIYESKSLNIHDFFVGWRLFVKSLIALIMYIIFVLLGFICFIIPGLIVASLFYYIIYCIMADDAGVIESFKCSLRLTQKLPMHTLLLLACATALGAVWFLLPVAALMNVYAYKQRQNSIAYDA